MYPLIATSSRRFGWALLAFIAMAAVMLAHAWSATAGSLHLLTEGEMMKRFLAIPTLAAVASLILLTACAGSSVPQAAQPQTIAAAVEPAKPYVAQVVGLQWLNPLQRRDYSTEWQLLWTLGLAKPNKNDDMVRTDPDGFSTVKVVSSIAGDANGKQPFKGYHNIYVKQLLYLFHSPYYSSSTYFYNVHSSKEKKSWRELAGIRVEYALPDGKLDPVEAGQFTREKMELCFNIGNPNFPTLWTRDTPPDVRITQGGPNAGFTSLSAALDYLQSHPNETVWAMNWDAPSYPPKDEQMNENLVLLVLAGPNYKTDREPLAWIGRPAVTTPADFELKQGQPPRVIQAWQAALTTAAANANKETLDIGYVIHDANDRYAVSSDRIGYLAQSLVTAAPELDFNKQSFNTPALLGDMGAGTALTNVALGIGYANHLGKNVLVAGTTDQDKPTAVVIVPPEKVRPIDHDKPWFRARGENNAYLMWWGIRHDEDFHMQGYSK